MDDFYRDKQRGHKVVFDPLVRGFQRHHEEEIYKDINDVKVPPASSNVSHSGMKICVAVLAITITLALVAAGIVLGVMLSQGSPDASKETTSTQAVTMTSMETSTVPVTSASTTEAPSITEPSTAADTTVLTTTEAETTTRTVTPVYNATDHSISYTFEDDFPEGVIAQEYLLYVSTEPDENLLNESITWAMVQGASPPYAYLALRCSDFENGCSGSHRNKNLRETTVQIGIEECNETETAIVCNGALKPNTSYYFILQLKQTDGAFVNGEFSAELKTNEPTSDWLAWTSWSDCTVTCGGLGVQVRSRECDQKVNELECVGDSSQTMSCGLPVCPATTDPPLPDYNATATTISYRLENNFPPDLAAEEYIVYVATQKDEGLLNDSITWSKVQEKTPPYAYVALRCSDLFVTGCTDNGESHSSDGIVIHIGTGDCNVEDLDTVCNGALEAGNSYYIVVQLRSGGTTIHSSVSGELRTSVYGTWTEWSEWAACDVSCGGGIQRKTRLCDGSEYCIGAASTSQRCNAQACITPVIAGEWLAWSAWTDCSVTCGGGAQVRTRECDRGSSDLDCVGDEAQNIDCNEWRCPDCSMACPTGHLSDSCTHCECHGEFEGLVQSTSGMALYNVHISISDTPYEVLNTTGVNGRFVLEKLCVSHTLTFYKEGYSSFTTGADWIPNIVQLEGEEPLVMDLQPTSKKRLVGDDVLLCCAAIGNPLPEFYEWFKNGLQIPGETGSTLSVTSVTLESAGSYRCRASTLTQAVYSTDATLTVKENPDDFCPESPESKFQQLPTGCLYDNETVIDVGECANLRCRGESVSNETCNDAERFCCAATQLESVDIQCDGFTFSLFKTISCGCSKCTAPSLNIQGFVFSAEDDLPLSDVDIYYNKTVVAKTTTTGQFYFNVPEGTRRVSVTAKPSNSSKYADGIGVLQLDEDADGVYYITIKLVTVILLTPFDSSVDQLLEVGTDERPMFELDIEKDSFYDAEGNLYQGSVQPQVSIIESNNQSQMENSPGAFETTDENGEDYLLQSYGMFGISFKGEDGQDLQAVKNLEMVIPEDRLGVVGESNPVSDIKLFYMYAGDAKWHEIAGVSSSTSTRRRKRQGSSYGITIAGISPGFQWNNFDAVARTTCHSKIRIFGSEEFTEKNQITGAQVFAFIEGDDDTYSFSTRLANSNDATNGYCLVHRCDRPGHTSNRFKGYLVAKKDGKYLVPAVNNTGLGTLESELEYQAFDDKLEVRYNLKSKMEGPFYNWIGKWTTSPKCTEAPFGDMHFRFHLQKEDQCYQFQEFSFKDDLTGNCKVRYFKSWYRAAEIRAGYYTTCYIRVQIAHYTNSVKVQAFSRVGTVTYAENGNQIISPGDSFGFHESCTVGGVICIKVKPPGKLGCSVIQAHDTEPDETSISVTARYKSSGKHLNVSDIHSDLRDEHKVITEESSFEFKMRSAGTIGGIFCKSGPKDESNALAQEACMTANEDEYAVKFGNSVECGADIVLILDTSGSMSSYSSTNKDWMLQIPEFFPVGDENIRVSLMLVYNNNYNQIWGLDSEYTSSNEQLAAATETYPTDEALSGRIGLADALTNADEHLTTHARDGATKVIVMFWDGDSNLEATVAGFTDTWVLSVAPNTNNQQEVESIVEDPAQDMFYLSRNSSAVFVERLSEITNCN